MIIDFHVHGKISKRFPFDTEKFLLTVNEAKEGGLDSLALTEHCDADNFLEGYEFLNSNYKLIGDCYNIEGFKVFYGMEVTTEQKLDILIIGNPQSIIELREKVNARLNGKDYIDINDLFKIHLSDELLIILAHPFRRHEEFPKLENDILDRIDAIEFNAKDLYKSETEEMKSKVLKLADEIKLPIVCGSDTHYFIQMSSVKNNFNNNYGAVQQIREEIRLKNYETELSSELKIRVKSAIIIKKLICNK